MTTQQSSSPATPSPKKSRNGIITASLVALFLLIGYLTYTTISKGNALDQSYTELNEAHTLNAELEHQYNDAIAELESLKGSNTEMNALIEMQKKELEAQKDKIARLLTNQKKLKQARNELANLQSQMQQYLVDIEQLKTQNAGLTEANGKLIVDKDSLHNALTTKIMENVQLNEARAMLVSNNQDLSGKVHLASVIKVENVKVEGLKTRANGKLKEKSAAGKVEMLKVCFTTTTNEIVRPGVEQFFVRIVDPRGETLAVESLGSGSIRDEKTGEEIRFTQTAETDYENDSQNLCLLWNPGTAFMPGKYQVEVFNKGYLAGTSSFELK